MANDNVKVIINEKDATTPLGAGTSSDIVFVPGFSSKFDAPSDTPILCSTVSDFESYFGKKPKVLTATDVEGYTALGYQAGDYDKSYIFAKEILHNGMSVLYANVGAPESSDTSYSVDSFEISKTQSTVDKNLIESEVPENAIKLNGTTLSVLTTLPVTGEIVVSGSADNVEIKPSEDFPEYIVDFTPHTEFDTEIGSLALSGFHLSVEHDSNTNVKYLSDTAAKISFVNKETSGELVSFNFTFVFKASKLRKGSVEFAVHEFTSSALDKFYGESGVSKFLNLIEERSEYSVKYITSGGYPACIDDATTDYLAEDKLGVTMMTTARKRGDAVALIDYQLNYTDKLYTSAAPTSKSTSVYAKLQDTYGSVNDASYGAAFYPWGVYTCANTMTDVDSDNMNVIMPPSFGYMMCLSTAIKTSPNWLAMAGVARGTVPNLKRLCTSEILTNTIAENYQPKFGGDNATLSVNAITNIRPYGLTIWGNRTMLPVDPKGTRALNFLNTRNMVSDIKKVLYSTARELMFEQDSDTLWLKFKSKVSPLLNQLMSGNGLASYKIIRSSTKYDGTALTRGELAAVVRIQPLYAIEYFELTVEISDQDVSVE